MKDLSAKLGEASTTVTRILGDNEADVKQTMASLRETAPKLQATMDRIDRISAKIENGEGSLGKLVQDDTLYDEASRMFKESRHAAEDVREQVPIITFTSVLFGAFQ
jgi:ABC-type transporter Mla subunit MlaD